MLLATKQDVNASYFNHINDMGFDYSFSLYFPNIFMTVDQGIRLIILLVTAGYRYLR